MENREIREELGRLIDRLQNEGATNRQLEPIERAFTEIGDKDKRNRSLGSELEFDLEGCKKCFRIYGGDIPERVVRNCERDIVCPAEAGYELREGQFKEKQIENEVDRIMESEVK